MRAVHCLRQLLLSLSLPPLTLFTRHSPILPLNLSPTAWLRSIIAHQQRVAASVAVAVGFALFCLRLGESMLFIILLLLLVLVVVAVVV